MVLSSRFSRRGVVALVAALGLQRLTLARAQAPCSVQFVNGILQFNQDCAAIDAPGMNGMAVAPPSHLIVAQDASTTTATTSPQQVRQERLQRRRDRRGNKRGRKRDRKDKGQLKRRTERAEALAAEITCDDFSTQKQALDHMAQFGDPDAILDTDRDGLSCEHLMPVTCSQFSTQKDAEVWFNARGFVDGNNDPFKLVEVVDGKRSVCGEHFSTSTN